MPRYTVIARTVIPGNQFTLCENVSATMLQFNLNIAEYNGYVIVKIIEL